MTRKNGLEAIGVTLKTNEVLLFFKNQDQKNLLQVTSSQDGFNFGTPFVDGSIAIDKQRQEESYNCSDLRIAKSKNQFFLTYRLRTQKHTFLHNAVSTDLLSWKRLGKISKIKGTGMIAPDYDYQGKYIMYFGENSVGVAFSQDLKNWEIAKQPVLDPRKDYFDDSPLEVGGVIPMGDYLLLIYYAKKDHHGVTTYSAGAALLDKRAPEILLWRSSEPIWQEPEDWRGEKIYPIGAIYLNERLLLYWEHETKGVFVVSCLTPGQNLVLKDKIFALILKKFGKNPIIKPIPQHPWESKATFNTAALYEDGKVHFIYRAIGDKDISVLGYASSSNGLHINERLASPAYIPTEPFECPNQIPVHFTSSFISGGGYGGCEDPRLTRIGDKIYMTYVAFDGANPPRVALTSIKAEDFLSKKWSWEKPILISQPGVVDKNACLLPEKINGKYVVFHRIFPNILIDFVDNLDFQEYLKGEFMIKPRQDYWDSLKIGVGAPPMKTTDGWLLIYHAVGNHDRGRYKIGAMILDENDPTKVIYRSSGPILEPTEHYENEGHKSGVAYPCGAVIIKDHLFVYYGGADTVVCAATENLDKFLYEIKSSHLPKLEPIIYPLEISSLRQ
ncbi:MAG: hypothetical protein Q8P89_02645 [bacterium]|nr:hypothetical protein [bacterium]